MKKIRCLLWFILLGLNLQAQMRVDTTYYDSYGAPKRIRSIKVIRGNKANVVVFNQRGQKTESFTLVDNKKNGKYTTYTASGTAISIVNFYNDLKHGEEVLFFNNGKKKSSIEYVANNPLGKFKFWNEAGVLIQKGSYDTLIKVFANRPNEASKVLSGKYESYFQNGKKEKESYYVKGKQNGESKEWYPSGISTTKAEYWAFVLEGTVLIVPLEHLRRAITLYGHPITCNIEPNPSKGYLIRPDKILQVVQELAR